PIGRSPGRRPIPRLLDYNIHHVERRGDPARTPIRTAPDCRMTDRACRIFLCHEPDHEAIAGRIAGWERTNSDSSLYAARREVEVDGPESRPIKDRLGREIDAADVLVCIVGQTTFIDPWVTWELTTAVRKPDRHGAVAV